MTLRSQPTNIPALRPSECFSVSSVLSAYSVLSPLLSALPKTASLTLLESTLPDTHESVSKQTTLTLLESALTRVQSAHSKQRTSNITESTLTQFVNVSPLESALPKKVWGGGVLQRRPSRAASLDLLRSATVYGGEPRVSVVAAWIRWGEGDRGVWGRRCAGSRGRAGHRFRGCRRCGLRRKIACR